LPSVSKTTPVPPPAPIAAPAARPFRRQNPADDRPGTGADANRRRILLFGAWRFHRNAAEIG
jgi:hypothetical protein